MKKGAAESPTDLMGAQLGRRAKVDDLGLASWIVDRSRHLPDVINLGRGDPDLPTPAHILEAATQAMEAGHTHYTPPRGLDSLREAIAEKLETENGLVVDPDDEVLVTTGTQEAVAVTMFALLDSGDEVILPDPYYSAYEYAIRYAGGTPVTVPTAAATAFTPDPDQIAKAITTRTKAIIVLTPNNPTGAVYAPTVLERIAELSLSTGVPIISDELYEATVFGDAEHFSIGSVPGMRDRTITINGFSKSYRMTGWRVGYLVGPPSFVGSARRIKHNLTICAPTISQHAATAALRGPQDCLQEARDVYGERRKTFERGLEELGLPYFRPAGTFYVLVDITSLGMSSTDFCLDLLEEASVLLNPGAAFGRGGEGYARVSLLAPTPQLEEALDRVEHFLHQRARRQRNTV
jgi:aminotransferase